MLLPEPGRALKTTNMRIINTNNRHNWMVRGRKILYQGQFQHLLHCLDKIEF
jgi:hypothetical protein